MPLLDIAIAQSSFQSYLGYSRVQLFINDKIPNYSLLRHEERWASFRKSFHNTGNVNYLGHSKKSQPKLLVKAVATLEPKCPAKSVDGKKESNVLPSSSPTLDIKSSSGDSEEVNEREKLRRLRISKANKGNTPWNKGRKHSPETLQRIKERTRLAMQNPKVKMKLTNMGHAQSPETREKIGVGVRMGWQKRRQRLMLQETCLFDWQNLIAEAARKGFHDEEELQWDSYKILNEQLQKEWLASIEYRKTTPRPKGSKRAPKSLEQRRKIAEAIAAKWADPEYRSRVCSGLAKFHGTPEGAERKVRRKPSSGSQSTRKPKEKATDAGNRSVASEINVKTQPKLKKRTAPKYKDPLASSKLEMLKSIRAQRVASETKKNEALERAKLLIAEAEKAAKALEVAATRSPVARASLIEAKKLIAEATKTIESIETGELVSQDNAALPGQKNHVKRDGNALTEDDADGEYHRGVNGIKSLQETEFQTSDIDLYKLTVLDRTNMDYELSRSSGSYEFPKLNLESFIRKSELRELMDQQHSPELSNGAVKLNGVSSHNGVKLQINEDQKSPAAAKTVTKKWVRGRLVEVVEGD